MCELFALSSRIPTTVGFTLERLARRGGIEGPHRVGWGVAFYEGADVFLLREPRAAAQSDLVRYTEQHAPPSQLVVSHIRRATRGEPALRNTQPFIRELGGYTHVFAHNGELGGIERRRDFQTAGLCTGRCIDTHHPWFGSGQRRGWQVTCPLCGTLD